MAEAANPSSRPAADAAACVLVTRPQPQADDWVARLQALGVAAHALPLLTIADAAERGPVRAAWAALPAQALVMFVSPSAVERFFRQRPAGAGGWPPQVWAGSTGPGTARALLAAGVPAAALVTPPEQAQQFDSEALWRCLAGRRDWRGAAALIVRGEGGRDWLADTLRGAGAKVAFVEAYRRVAPVLDADQRHSLAQALQAPASFVWLFSSSEAAGHLRQLAPGADWSLARALATHPRIAQAAQALGFGQVRLVAPSPQAVADAQRPAAGGDLAR